MVGSWHCHWSLTSLLLSMLVALPMLSYVSLAMLSQMLFSHRKSRSVSTRIKNLTRLPKGVRRDFLSGRYIIPAGKLFYRALLKNNFSIFIYYRTVSWEILHKNPQAWIFKWYRMIPTQSVPLKQQSQSSPEVLRVSYSPFGFTVKIPTYYGLTLSITVLLATFFSQ